MNTILDTIVTHKRREIAQLKSEISTRYLERSAYFKHTCFSLPEHLRAANRTGIIAEFKRQSPSKGSINASAKVDLVTHGYNLYGASALSVLTDEHFFGGSKADLEAARQNNDLPILRKDFVIDEFQILEAKAIGADVVLLIAECLSKAEIKTFTETAQNLGLNVLLELHSEAQLDKISVRNNIIGINNRDLKTFKVDLERSVALADQLPEGSVKIAESGISDPKTVHFLKSAGFEGFLMGEHFMKAQNPVEAFQAFTEELHQLVNPA